MDFFITNRCRLGFNVLRTLILFVMYFSFSAVLATELDWLDDYNVVWDSQSENSAGSMPCGGHDIGLNVWAENDDILFYMQRSGSIAENNEYLKLGRIRVRMTPNPFTEGHFKQTLNLQQGLVEIQGSKTYQGKALTVNMKVWVEALRPIIHVEIDANQDIEVDVAYENWRLAEEVLPNNQRRHSVYVFDSYPGIITLSGDTIEQTDDGVVFYHRNPNNKQMPGIVLAQQGLEAYADEICDDIKGRTFGGMLIGDGFKRAGQTEGKYQVKPYKAWHINSVKPAKSHSFRVVTCIEQTETVDLWKSKLQSLVQQSRGDIAKAGKLTFAWWSNFWNRSRICINPDKPDPSSKPWRVARNYNIFRYQLACNTFGKYPTRFNGGNFTFDANLVGGNSFGPDWRKWGGGVFTAQNQRLLYWPMLKAGDFVAMQSQFELYKNALGGARARVKEYFGHDGALYSEYNSMPGVALGSAWGWESGSRGRGTEMPFGDKRADGNSRYNALVEKGIMANQSIAYHWESQLEHAYMIMEYARFSGADIRQYMPFIENAIIFFDEHYRLRQKMRNGKELDDNGKLVIFPSTSCETYRGAKDPVDVVAGLEACLNSIIDLDDKLLALRDKAYYKSFLATIPNYSFGEIDGNKVIRPAESWMSVKNIECPHFYPLFPFNRFDLQGKDSDQMQTFRNTWKYDKTFPKNMVISWHQDGIFLARMGLVDEAVSYNVKKLDNSPLRFPTFWGPGHDWTPDHNWGGSGMIGLQEMLMQTIDGKIHILPCWPKDWDVEFKLHAPEDTIVECEFRNGVIKRLSVSPGERMKDIRTNQI